MLENTTPSPPVFDRAVRYLLANERVIVLLLLVTLIAAAWAYLVAHMPSPRPDYDHPPLAAMRPWIALSDAFSRAFYSSATQVILRGADLRVAFPLSLSSLSFLVMWLIMIAAMMLPTAVPTILAYLNIIESGRARQPLEPAPGSSGVFILGYVLVWTVAAFVGAFLQVLFLQLALKALLSAPEMDYLHVMVSAGVLLTAGLYQFSTWKDACLRECRSPMRFFLSHWRDGYAGAFAMGVRHGLSCLGCCWALMAVMYVVGVMNLVWMAGLGILMLGEKIWHHGHLVRRLSGFTFILWGIIVLVYNFS